MTRDEMDNMLERERNMRADIEMLSRENRSLKANWQAADQEYRRLAVLVPQLQDQVRVLGHENRQLRHSIDNDSNASERLRELRIKYTRVQNENEGLRQTVRHLKSEIHDAVDDRARRLRDTVDQLMVQVKEWRLRYETSERSYKDIHNRYSRIKGAHDVALARNAELQDDNDRLEQTRIAYERILRRHRLLP